METPNEHGDSSMPEADGSPPTLSPFELKDQLMEIADESAKTRAAIMLNAGRGNPNWIATTPREAYYLLGEFSLSEARRTWDEPEVGLAGMPQSPGIGKRLREFLDGREVTPSVELLRGTVEFGVRELGFDEDKFVWELVDSLIGDNYPVPDRMLVHAEQIVRAFIARELCDGRPPEGTMQYFAVEGGTAAMTYLFRSLAINQVLRRGDTIALGTPIFTPYLEMPHLDEHPLKVVALEASEMGPDGRHTWQYPDSEIDKLADPRIKAFFVVNPSNPGSVAMRESTRRRLVELVKTKRPDLLILTDDVYATFVNGFRSLAAELPHNTILVYSYSKHFGCTGWRLGVVGMQENHLVDELIAALPADKRDRVNARYLPINQTPEKLKFIDRLVADSRSVALNHTAGLSLPQQVQMMLFSTYSLLDKGDTFKKRCQKICHDRLEALARGLGVPSSATELSTAYYQTIDIEAWCRKEFGPDFMDFIEEHHDPLDLVFALARRYGTVLLNGSGFHGPPWSARVSLANLDDDAYPQIGAQLRDLVGKAVERWKEARQ
jgi:aspartate 4-decarboxylase